MGEEAQDSSGYGCEGVALTKLERAIDALYRGRCNLIQACSLAEVDQETMKKFLLDKVQCTPSHPLQLSLDLRNSDQ
jgi:hypothetical protein